MVNCAYGCQEEDQAKASDVEKEFQGGGHCPQEAGEEASLGEEISEARIGGRNQGAKGGGGDFQGREEQEKDRPVQGSERTKEAGAAS